MKKYSTYSTAFCRCKVLSLYALNPFLAKFFILWKRKYADVWSSLIVPFTPWNNQSINGGIRLRARRLAYPSPQLQAITTGEIPCRSPSHTKHVQGFVDLLQPRAIWPAHRPPPPRVVRNRQHLVCGVSFRKPSHMPK